MSETQENYSQVWLPMVDDLQHPLDALGQTLQSQCEALSLKFEKSGRRVDPRSIHVELTVVEDDATYGNVLVSRVTARG